MQLVVLSDHAGDRLAAARERRESAARKTVERHQRELEQHRSWVAEATQVRDRALTERRVLAWLRWWLEARRRRRAWTPRPAALPGVSAEEGALEGGVSGEQEVAQVLGRRLGADWTVFKGYRNGRGEIDFLVLGPAGLFAVEVKNVNGTFWISPGRWRYVKYDRYDIARDESVLEDEGHRPPDRQLLEPTRQLERFLASRGRPARLEPVVVLTHSRARIERLDGDLGAQVVISAERLASLVLAAGGNFTRDELVQISRLIERDHRFHNRHRRHD